MNSYFLDNKPKSIEEAWFIKDIILPRLDLMAAAVYECAEGDGPSEEVAKHLSAFNMAVRAWIKEQRKIEKFEAGLRNDDEADLGA